MAKTSAARTGQVVAAAFGNGLHVVIGTLVCVDEGGTPHVDFPGNRQGAIAARVVGAVCAEASMPPPAVALVFEGGDRLRPLILGLVSDHLSVQAAPQPLPAASRDVVIDGNKIRLDAESELTLRCGNASILLRRDGKLIIKGTEVVSRASGANKIKGGLVNIN